MCIYGSYVICIVINLSIRVSINIFYIFAVMHEHVYINTNVYMRNLYICVYTYADTIVSERIFEYKSSETPVCRICIIPHITHTYIMSQKWQRSNMQTKDNSNNMR